MDISYASVTIYLQTFPQSDYFLLITYTQYIALECGISHILFSVGSDFSNKIYFPCNLRIN